MADAIQELKLVLSLDTKAYQAGLKGAKTSLLGLSSAQVAFGMMAAQYAMRGIDAVVKQYKEYDQALDKLSYRVTDYNRASRAMLQANTMTTASLRTVGDVTAVYAQRVKGTSEQISRLTYLTAQYAEDTGDSAHAAALGIADLADAWMIDEGALMSKLMKAGQMGGMAISEIAEQALEATPYMKGMGKSFTDVLAEIVAFKTTGKDYLQFVNVIARSFDKFGGNTQEATAEIKGMINTVRRLGSESSAISFLMQEFGVSYKQASILANVLRGETVPEIDKAAEALNSLANSDQFAADTIAANMNIFDKLELWGKSVWNNILNGTDSTYMPEVTKGQFEKYQKLLKAGYSRNEISRMFESDSYYDMWEKLNSDPATKSKVAPGQVLKMFPSTGPWVNDQLLTQLEKIFQKYLLDAPEKKSSTSFKIPGAFQSASMWASDYGGSGMMQIMTDMERMGDTGQLVANRLQGGFRTAFIKAADYADNSSSVIRAELIPVIDGTAVSVDNIAAATEEAAQGTDSMTTAAVKTQTAWEKIEGWVNKAVEKLGIDPEILENNIWTGLARIAKESLENMGVDVDGLEAKVKDFFSAAKGYGFDINQFWTWMQTGTGQSTEQIWASTLDNMARATGNFIMKASAMFATGTMDWKQLFSGLFSAVLASTVTAVAKMVADWIAGLQIIAQAKTWLETMPGAVAAIAIGALAVGGIAMLAASKANQPAMAEGGLVTGPTRALIGEAGPEVVFPLEKLNQLGIPYGRGSAGSARSSGNSIINITVNNPILNNRTTESDVREFMDRMGRQMVRKGGAFANSYS